MIMCVEGNGYGWLGVGYTPCTVNPQANPHFYYLHVQTYHKDLVPFIGSEGFQNLLHPLLPCESLSA